MPPEIVLRGALVALAATSGGALLLEVYGVASLRAGTLLLLLPAMAATLGAWVAAARGGRGAVAGSMTRGAVGGLLGTLAYDAVRVPFTLAGRRVFVPIRVYGMWITDAAASSAWTDLVGWAYHASNGLSFGMMYALALPRGGVVGAVLWALALETIAVASPFGVIFGPYSPGLLAIAYLGHVAYGMPLGRAVRHGDPAADARRARAAQLLVAGVSAAVVAGAAVGAAAPDCGARPCVASMRVVGARLSPDILRVDRGAVVALHNANPVAVTLRVGPAGHAVALGPSADVRLRADASGIFHILVEGMGPPTGSFLVVEPVEARARAAPRDDTAPLQPVDVP